ncbi:MAG: CHAT domain-containing protein [Acidobacteriia bacterium]|nr:CHAT domain-containing protein [Terriglobia bacterium]
MRPKPNADCEKERDLQEVAAQMASPETSTRVLQHASQCDYCGSLLKQYLEDFSEELSPEIEMIIAQMPSAQPQWQQKKATDLAASVRPLWRKILVRVFPPREDGKPSFFPIRATAGALATLLVGIGITRGPAIMNWWQLWQAKGTISAAYAQKRTIPGRLTGVKAGPLDQGVQTMGSGEVEDLGWKLNKAVAMLPSSLASGDKVDPRWLQIEGRILLLKYPHNPEKAEQSFLRAQSMGMKDFSLDIDLAVTHFEEEKLRAEQDPKKHKPDFRKTTDELEKVLASTNPAPTPEERKTALYNLALTYQTENKLDLAIPKWEEYLKADPAGAWADDVRRHLEDDNKKKAPPHAVYLNLFDYNQHVREPAVSRDVEQYLPIGFERGWLRQAFEGPASEAGKAARNIAENLRQQHSDPMLADLLSSVGQGRLPKVRALNAAFASNSKQTEAFDCPGKNGEDERLAAIRALSAAFADNKNDKQTEAIGCSRKAAELFRRSGNPAGELLAQYQEIYALQRELNSAKCLEQVEKVLPRVDATPYHWLRGQLALEKAICATREFKSKSAQDGLDASSIQAEKFPELSLRIIGAEAGLDRLNHYYLQAWRTASEGLAQCWKDSCSPERYYQFYAVMRLIAADSGYLHASEAYLRKSIEIFETSVGPDDFRFQALLYTALANLQWELGEDAAAEATSRHARELIERAKDGKAAIPVFLEVPAIELADFELRRHQWSQALSTLQQLGNKPQTQDSFVQLDFYRVRGDAKLQSGGFNEATEDYQHGLDVAQEFFKHSTDEDTRLRWVLATNKIYAGIVQILLKKGQSEKALAVWEWSKSRLLDRENRHLLGIEEAGSLSLPPTAYPHIVYASFEDQMQIWLVKNGRTVGESVHLKQVELLGSIRDFNMNCRNRNSLESEVERQGAELYKLFLRPVIADLPASGTVAIEFDDAFPSFAIDALKTPAGSDFGDGRVVLHSPGILAEIFLRESGPLKPKEKFLVADASPTGDEALRGHALPAGAISQTYSNEVLMGTDLTPQKLDQKMQTSAALLVVSHGMLGDEGIGLKMSEDWSLQAKDFTPQRLHKMSLVVLAACSSGFSENGLGGPDSLVRSLLAGGVPNVIASRWDVDSQSTGELFESFYTFLAQGETPARALQHARRAFRKAHPERTHPYYWAGFYLTGKAN